MAIVAGVTVSWRLSPRIITIPAPLTSITIEDFQDTLLDLEYGVEGILHEDLRNTSGGEDLGSGRNVGFTMELQNAQLEWEARTTKDEEGAVTTPDTGGEVLEDSGATFIANGITRGAIVANFTDMSFAAVISVISETQLTTRALSGGTDNEYGSGDLYAVYNMVEGSIVGGNLVAVDGVGTPISPNFTTFGVFIDRASDSGSVLVDAGDHLTKKQFLALK